MVVNRSIFPLASRSEMKEITREFSVDSDTVTHQVHPIDPKKTVRIYAHLPEEKTTALLAFLRQEWKIFACCQFDMPEIPREFTEHELNICPNTKVVK